MALSGKENIMLSYLILWSVAFGNRAAAKPSLSLKWI
jgi:hypothetical protein